MCEELTISPMSTRKRVVIVGGGFGGYVLFKKLSRARYINVILFDKTGYLTFTPLLPDSISGVPQPGRLAVHVPFPRGGMVVQEEIVSVDLDKKIVNGKHEKYSYDYLVLATGATVEDFGIPGVREYAWTLKSVEDAVRIREWCAMTRRGMEPRSAVVVGGGPTGVELAAELAEGLPRGSKVILVQKSSELLLGYPVWMRSSARDVLLKKLGVRVMINMSVDKIFADGVSILGGEHIEAEMIIWTAGVKPNFPDLRGLVEFNERGRIKTNSKFEIEKYPGVFVIGDGAAVLDAAGAPLPQLAQVAEKEGRALARIICRLSRGKKSKGFGFKSPGMLLGLGSKNGLAEVWGVHFSGFWGAWLRRAAYMWKMPLWRTSLGFAADYIRNKKHR